MSADVDELTDLAPSLPGVYGVDMSDLERIESQEELIEHLVKKKLSHFKEVAFPTLESVEAYGNDDVIDNYLCIHPDVNRDKAEALFTQTRRGLWRLARSIQEEQPLDPAEAFENSDCFDMWDAFVLCTKIYWGFCQFFFGTYLHRIHQANFENWSGFGFSGSVHVPSLEKVLVYRNQEIVDTFLALYDVTEEQAEELFVETLKWLWLCASTRGDLKSGRKAPKPRVDNDLLMLDEMWHLFILYSNHYFHFCADFFGFYIHHKPTTQSEKNLSHTQLLTDRAAFINELAEDERSFFSYVHEKLGRETLIKWNTESALFA